MKKFFALSALAASVVLAGGLASNAHAGFATKNTQACEITGNRFGDLQEAVRLYNKSRNRACTWLISLIDDNTEMKLTSPISIWGMPVHGRYGTLISTPRAARVTLDASGLGDCPVKVGPHSVLVAAYGEYDTLIDIQRVTIKADDVNRAVCTLDGEPVYDGVDHQGHVRTQTNAQKNTAYIHDNVTILPSENADADADNDRIQDRSDNCPEVWNPDQRNTDHLADGGDACDPDLDGDNIANEADNCPNASNPRQLDDDSDGLGNSCEDDDDGDGVRDLRDNCLGVFNPINPLTGLQQDTDGDHFGDACDHDDDNDRIRDDPAEDNCPLIANPGQEDADSDGLGDLCDDDADNDGLEDDVDPCPYDANVARNSLGECASEPPPPPPPPDLDADNDGLNDDVDPCPFHAGVVRNSLGECAPEPPPPPSPPLPPSSPDADGDGLSDEVERDLGTEPEVADTDGDGAQDPLDCAPFDVTRSTGDSCIVVIEDTDLDDDGVPNADDNCLFALNADQMDSDVDGIGDACDVAVFLPSESESIDGDSDGLPDELEGGKEFCSSPQESDTDGDGLSDGVEATGITNQNGRGGCDPDVDADGICDGPVTILEKDESGEVKKDDAGNDIVLCTTNPATGTGGADNCPIVENEDQADEDGDGTGDACEGDDDGDSIVNEEDNCPFIANREQRDDDDDGAGDACDLDFDVFAALSAAEGCGCRIGSERPGDIASMIPFLAIGLPVVFFRVMRRGKKIAG